MGYPAMKSALDPWRLYCAAVLVFLVTPILLIVFFAFTSRGLANFPVEALSLRWWRAMWERAGFLSALKNSLIVSSSVAVLAATVGTATAVGLAKLPKRAALLLMAALSIPIVIPPLLLAVALLVAFARTGFGLGLHSVILSQLLFTVPFVVILVYGRVVGIDDTLVDSARDLGASPWIAFRTVLLPLMAPSVIGAALISFALSIDDYVVTSFTIGGGNTLPTFVWGMMRTSAGPIVNAIGTVIILFTVGATLSALRLTRYRG
jgi:spermidine/putrescine transport system permease protein